MIKNKNIIKCPKCGQEYLPGEIFLPQTLLGQPKAIVRDENGVILNYEGKGMDLIADTYYCDKCGQGFNVEATLSFTVNALKNDFVDEF